LARHTRFERVTFGFVASSTCSVVKTEQPGLALPKAFLSVGDSIVSQNSIRQKASINRAYLFSTRKQGLAPT